MYKSSDTEPTESISIAKALLIIGGLSLSYILAIVFFAQMFGRYWA